MNRFVHVLMAVVILASCRYGVAATFYVAPNGDDRGPGSDVKPFATIQRARDEIRKLKHLGLLTGPTTVYLRGGTYRIEKTLTFTPEDSGTEQAPITYAASVGQQPTISGGRPIAAWQKGSGALWQATIPEVQRGQWYFHQLFFNGQRRTRARTPNQGYLYTEGILAPFNRNNWSDPKILAKRGFRFRNSDIQQWKNPGDALIVIYHSWTTSIHLITQLDSQERIVKLAPPSSWPIGYWWEYNTRYHVENIIEALDEPGEWYLDRRTGVLSYWPVSGEDMANVEVIAPVVRQTLMDFQGRPEKKQFIEYLRFQGISFQHTDCYIGADMPLDEQGATERLPLVAAVGLRHARFEDCEIAHAGENGLWLDRGCCDNLVRGCHIHDLGGSAVFVGPKGDRDSAEDRVERNTVDNNFIHDGSHIFRGSQGVWIGRSSFNLITHNEISDFHHLGISIGHSWGYAPSTAHHNLVAFNHVHHICNGYFSDGGGIYTLGISPGTIIRNNIVHDVVPTPLMPVGGTGIYHDEGSSGILVENNIVYRVGSGAYNQHYGRENVARNNIFAFGGRDTITCCRPEEHLSFTFEGNIVVSSAGQATSDHYSPLRCKTEFRRNLYWDVSGTSPLFSGVSFAKWQQTGRDRDSKIADPQFYDAGQGDFRLKPTSPALSMGFQPIATAQVGLYGAATWVAGPSKVTRAPLAQLPEPPPAPPPRPFLEDFESMPAGKQPETMNCMPSNRPDALGVSEENAAGGKRSLRFAKVQGLKHGFEPHVYFTSSCYTSGKVRFGCDLMNTLEHPAECSVGLRDYVTNKARYLDGASICVKSDGTVTASGKSLCKVPLGKWLHLDIQVGLGASDHAVAAAKGSRQERPGHVGRPQNSNAVNGSGIGRKNYRVAITMAGRQEQVFEMIPYVQPDFAQLTWWGFSSGGKPGGVFYVDNIRLESVRP
jgi:hypothetical protein